MLAIWTFIFIALSVFNVPAYHALILYISVKVHGRRQFGKHLSDKLHTISNSLLLAHVLVTPDVRVRSIRIPLYEWYEC